MPPRRDPLRKRTIAPRANSRPRLTSPCRLVRRSAEMKVPSSWRHNSSCALLRKQSAERYASMVDDHISIDRCVRACFRQLAKSTCNRLRPTSSARHRQCRAIRQGRFIETPTAAHLHASGSRLLPTTPRQPSDESASTHVTPPCSARRHRMRLKPQCFDTG